MSKPDRSKAMKHLRISTQLQPALHRATHAPHPDLLDNDEFRAYTRSPHDVGGEYDVSVQWQNKEEEIWEHNTFITCEVLAWRGVWSAEERRRRQNSDVGQTQYLGLSYYARWLLSAARILVDKQYVTNSELSNKMNEVRQRYE